MQFDGENEVNDDNQFTEWALNTTEWKKRNHLGDQKFEIKTVVFVVLSCLPKPVQKIYTLKQYCHVYLAQLYEDGSLLTSMTQLI